MSHLQEAGSAELGWAFWTKVVVVIIGFIGGLSFVFAQVNYHVHYSPIKEPTMLINQVGIEFGEWKSCKMARMW